MTRAVDRLTEENNCTEAVLAFDEPPGIVIGGMVLVFVVFVRIPLLLKLFVAAAAGVALVVALTSPMIIARTGDTILLVRAPLVRRRNLDVIARLPRDGTVRATRAPRRSGFHVQVPGYRFYTTAERERVSYILGDDIG